VIKVLSLVLAGLRLESKGDDIAKARGVSAVFWRGIFSAD